MKELASGDFLKAWGGIASLQFALPVLWTAAKARDCAPDHIAKWLCSNPSKLPGLEGRKGKIQKGYDADLVVWDPDKSFIVTENLIRHRHKICPYIGEQLFGVVQQTYLHGEKVFDHGNIVQLNKGRIILGNQSDDHNIR
jgi:allantoinase